MFVDADDSHYSIAVKVEAIDGERSSNLKENFEEMNGNGSHSIAGGIDSNLQSTWMPKEESLHEDVLDIAADKSLVEDLDSAAIESKPNRDRDADRKKIAVKKERGGKEEDDKDRDSQKDRVFICNIVSHWINWPYILYA